MFIFLFVLSLLLNIALIALFIKRLRKFRKIPGKTEDVIKEVIKDVQGEE